MTDNLLNSLTVEEAVAQLIRLDYIPEGFSLEAMLRAFLEEAEVDLENAKNGFSPNIDRSALQIRLTGCQERLAFAKILSEDISYCAENKIVSEDGGQLVSSKDSNGRLQIDTSSLVYWAASRYGIGITANGQEVVLSNPPPKSNWSDITIYLRSEARIGLKISNGTEDIRKAHEVGLGHQKRTAFNVLGGILLGAAEGLRYPPGNPRIAMNNEKKRISVLRNHLKSWTGLTEDPFNNFNPKDGWVPKFKIKNKINISKERAEADARKVSYNEKLHGGAGTDEDY